MVTLARTDSTPVIPLVSRLSAEAEQEGGFMSLAKAAKLLGATAPSTAFRHATKGVALAGGRRCVLETIRSGKKLLTTKAAVQRFLEAQQQGTSAETLPIHRSPAARRKASESASTRADDLLA